MNDELTPVQRGFNWLVAELRADIAHTGSFSLSKEMLDSLDGFERKSLLRMMFWTAVEKGEWSLAEFCLRESFPIQPSDTGDSGPIHDAMELLGDRDDVVEWLVARGADIERRSASAFTPLLAASARGFAKSVRALVEMTADVNASTIIDEDMTAVMLAAQRGHEGIVRDLIAAGVDLTRVNRRGLDAACVAEEVGYMSIAEFLRSQDRQSK